MSMMTSKLKLYSHWISSCAWRVRIALNLKGLDYEYKIVNLIKGDQFSPEFQNLNPLGKVPALVDDDIVVADSLAIIMYLEDKYPQHPLLPQNLRKKALNYQVSSIVASGIQPLHNLKYIEEKLGSNEMLLCGQHHIKKGLAAVEKLLRVHSGKYATGDEIALADVFLAPQLGSCKRFNVDLAEFPLLRKLNDAYSELPPFQNAVPEKQPGAPNSVKF